MIRMIPLPTEQERKHLRGHFGSRAISWLSCARAGSEVIYHRGLLLIDRLDNPALDIEAQVYYLAAQEGYAELMQLRFVPALYGGGCAYIARRTHKRMTEAREELFRNKVIEGVTDEQIENRPRIVRPARLRSKLGRFLPASAAVDATGTEGHVEETPRGESELEG
jgi:hypothetical protein